MAKDWRTLKLELLMETKQFVDDMKKSETQVEGFGAKMEKFGKVAAAAFAAAAAAAVAYAGKLAIDGVQAAIADEAAQQRLANALKNVTGATETQISAVEKQISQMSLAFGVADEKLRPAFQRLATATGDLSKANEGLQLALDISAATGKDVEAVSNALGKAYEGNTGALGRLGIGLSSAEMKSLGLKGTMDQLADTFGGAATTQANTLEGQIARLKVGFDEAKESIGMALLPTVQKLMDYIVNKFIPILEDAKNKAIDPITKSLQDNKEAMQDLWAFTKNYLVPVFEFTLKNSIISVGKTIAGLIDIVGTVVNAVENLVNGIISKINVVISAYNSLPFQDIALIPLIGGSGSVGLGKRPMGGGAGTAGSSISLNSDGTIRINPITTNTSTGGGGGGGGSTASLGSFGSLGAMLDRLEAIDAEVKKLQFMVDTNQISKTDAQKALDKLAAETAYIDTLAGNYAAGADLPSPTMDMGGTSRGEYSNVTINVNSPSIIDEQGFTRAVIDALNSVEYRSGGGASTLAYL